MTEGGSGVRSGFHRTVARCESRLTSALSTAGTVRIASVTCRAQFPQVMPLISNWVSARADAGRGGFSRLVCRSVDIVVIQGTPYLKTNRCRPCETRHCRREAGAQVACRPGTCVNLQVWKDFIKSRHIHDGG